MTMHQSVFHLLLTEIKNPIVRSFRVSRVTNFICRKLYRSQPAFQIHERQIYITFRGKMSLDNCNLHQSERRMGYRQRALSRRLSKLTADETSIEFSEIISYRQQCFDPTANTHMHACCVMTSTCSWYKYSADGRFIAETKTYGIS